MCLEEAVQQNHSAGGCFLVLVQEAELDVLELQQLRGRPVHCA